MGTVQHQRRPALKPDGYTDSAGDCNDGDSTVFPSATERCDGQYNNCSADGYSPSSAPANEIDNDGDGYVECSLDAGGWDGSVAKLGDDCDDTDAGIYPGLSWYRDGDNDGFGSGEATLSCAQPENHVRNNTDCNDSRDFVYPGAGELCDGIVNNCSNLASGVPTNEIDNDGDGYVECTLDGTWLGASSKKGDDCNDTDASLSPETLWYQDSDEDAFGTSLSTSRQCTQPVGYIATPGDCDDADITVYPGPASSAMANTITALTQRMMREQPLPMKQTMMLTVTSNVVSMPTVGMVAQSVAGKTVTILTPT